MSLKGKLFTLGGAVLLGVLLAPKRGRETRKDLKAKFNEVKQEVARRTAKTKKLSRAAYHEAVRDVLAYYKRAKKLNDAEMRALERDLKPRWSDIVKAVEGEGARKHAPKKAQTKRRGTRNKR